MTARGWLLVGLCVAAVVLLGTYALWSAGTAVAR